MDEKTKKIQAVVEAVTEKYGGGVKLEGTFYNLAEGLDLPEKGEEIVATILGKTIIDWERVKEDEMEKSEQGTGPEGEKGLELPDIEVPGSVRAVADTFLAVLKHIDERVPNMSTKDKIIVASVIFKEIMETKRAKIRRKGEE